MPFNNGAGGDWFTPADGTYIGKLIGFEDGPSFPRQREQPDGSTKTVQDATMRWKFELKTTMGVEVIDPKTSAQAVGEGLSSTTLGKGREGNEAKGRRWLRALYASRGETYPEGKDPQEIANGALGASAILTYEGGKLKDVSPAIGVTA